MIRYEFNPSHTLTFLLTRSDKIPAMRKFGYILLLLSVLFVLAFAVYRLPWVNQRLSWRLDFARAYMRGVISPIEAVPTPVALASSDIAGQTEPTSTRVVTPTALPTNTFTPTPGPTATPIPSPTPLPQRVSLGAPKWEKQDINNCGPTTLAMYLRFYGWDGDQFEISSLLKPERVDRNVNVEELIYYVRTRAGWLNAEYRVGGDLELLKKLIAAGIPVMVEESFYFENPFWPNDDLWAAHYNLVTGFDDTQQIFTTQDSYRGADQQVPYDILDEYWQAFNRVYILIYRPEQEETVKAILAENWDVDINRENALENARTETERDPENAFAWFNLGTNLVYFDRYSEAAQAYDVARELGLPQRMLRYQFGPFMAYFHSGRTEDLMTLTEYALKTTPNSEEALLWHGWGNYRLGNTNQAIADFNQALKENPNYQDAQYALDYVRQNP